MTELPAVPDLFCHSTICSFIIKIDKKYILRLYCKVKLNEPT